MDTNFILAIAVIIIVVAMAGVVAVIFPPGTGNVTGQQASGRITREARPVTSFRRVKLVGSGVMTVEQGPKAALTVTADDDLLPYIESRVEEHTLTITYNPTALGAPRPTQMVRYHVVLPEIETLAISGGGSMQAGRITVTALTLSVEGMGSMVIDTLAAGRVNATVKGNSKITLGGRINMQVIDAGGSSTYDAGRLQSRMVQLKLADTVSATLWVTDTLNIDSFSAEGRIRYYGDPTISKDLGLFSNVERLGDSPE